MKRSIFAATLLAGAVFATAASAADQGVKPFAELDIYAGYNHQKSPDATHNLVDDGIIGSSNVGVSAEFEKITGKFVLGFQDASGDRKVQVRDAWVNFDNGSYSVKVGQFRAPSVFWSNEATFYNNSDGFGALNNGFPVQLKATFAGAYVDFLKSSFSGYDKGTARADVPVAAVGYDFDSEKIKAGFGGIGTYFNRNSEAANKKTYSWLGYAHTSLTFGDFSILGSFGYGQNTGNIGYDTPGVSANTSTITQAFATVDENGKIVNPTHYEGFVELGYQLSKELALHAGFGYTHTDFDQSGVKNDSASQYYLNGYYTVNSHLTLAPELSYYKYDKGTTNAKDASNIYAGVLAIAAF